MIHSPRTIERNTDRDIKVNNDIIYLMEYRQVTFNTSLWNQSGSFNTPTWVLYETYWKYISVLMHSEKGLLRCIYLLNTNVMISLYYCWNVACIFWVTFYHLTLWFMWNFFYHFIMAQRQTVHNSMDKILIS